MFQFLGEFIVLEAGLYIFWRTVSVSKAPVSYDSDENKKSRESYLIKIFSSGNSLAYWALDLLTVSNNIVAIEPTWTNSDQHVVNSNHSQVAEDIRLRTVLVFLNRYLFLRTVSSLKFCKLAHFSIEAPVLRPQHRSLSNFIIKFFTSLYVQFSKRWSLTIFVLLVVRVKNL